MSSVILLKFAPRQSNMLETLGIFLSQVRPQAL